jgi:oligopeptide/dipeptide ABC transporter ATP-binding protein
MPNEMMLAVSGLVKHFPIERGAVFKRVTGQVKAVDGVSFELARGETLGIVGESGCGKSTLAKLLLLLERPTAGEALLDGRDIFTMRGAELNTLRRQVQMVMQDPYTSLNPRMTVGDIIGEPFEIHTEVLPKRARAARVRELLDLVGLSPEHISRYPHQFSGGQRQRIGIARALALEPRIVVCDEPVSALDVSIQAQVINLLEELQARLALSFIFIAHDLSVVRHIADRVAVMYLGRIVETGTVQDIYEHATHPYTQALLSAAPEPDPSLRGGSRIIRLEGDVPSPANPPSGCRFRTRCWKAQPRCVQEEPALLARRAESASQLCACHYADEALEAPR